MTKYLEPSDQGAFQDMAKLAPEKTIDMRNGRPVAECAKCHGYGGWNLELDAYGPGKHFRASCDNCVGWGYVSEAQGSHVHEFDRGKYVSMCNTRYTCTTCGQVRDVDSSD